MKCVILAGGLGTRISEESYLKPKPMVEIGGMPILWHIMKIYAHYGIKDFIICAGYKQHVIKEFFKNYTLYHSDLKFDLKTGSVVPLKGMSEDWNVTVVDTGLETMTGGRIKRIREYIGGETFLLTYGDGVSDIDINKLIRFHKKHGKLATITAVHPEGRFGILNIENDTVKSFGEKIEASRDWVNGGFMVLEPGVIDYIKGDETPFEQEPLNKLSADGELMAFKHSGFWQCMDTMRDKQKLENLWQDGAPWKSW